jgi:PAS domain S-box-containing protein
MAGGGFLRAERFFMVLVACLLPAGAWAVGAPQRVLLLDSYGRNVAPISHVISIIRTELSSRSPVPIDLHEVSLEMARFAQPEQEVPFVNFLHERFADRPPDLVVTVGGPAFTFLVRHRVHLFADAPVLITGVAEQILRLNPVPLNAAVVPVRVNMSGMIEDILQTLPDTTSIAVIFGASRLEAFWVEEFWREAAAFADRVRFTHLTDLPFEEMKRRVAALPPHSAVFFGLLIVDAGGTPFDPSEALKAVVAAANAPVFSLHESFFGLGTVGGRLIQERTAGLQATEAALRILQGESPKSLPAPADSPEIPVYDWRVLQRWGISEGRLPPGSAIHFRQPSFWEMYRWRIVGGVGILIFQAFLIAWLLVQKHRRNHAEQALVKSEQRLRLITNALPVLIAYVDADQRYRFNNDAYRAWFGVSPGEALGHTIREVTGERFYQSVFPYVKRALAGEYVRYAQDMELSEGRSVSMEAIYVPDVDERGVVSGFYVLVMDVTDRNAALRESKRLQDELLHAGRISTMGELAGALAHEINQPLSAIMSNAQAATRFLNAPAPNLEEVKEILLDIAKEDARAGEVIRRLRTLLKKEKTEYELLNLNLIFHEVVGLLHSDAVIRDVTFSTELDPSLPPVRGDRIQLQQVALNLILNAFEAMNERSNGGRRVLVRTGLANAQVTAAVADNGSGIPAGEAERIFNPFYTSKPQGLGMGLSISRSIIKNHQGRLWVENNPDGGATFYFSLPVAVGEPASKHE